MMYVLNALKTITSMPRGYAVKLNLNADSSIGMPASVKLAIRVTTSLTENALLQTSPNPKIVDAENGKMEFVLSVQQDGSSVQTESVTQLIIIVGHGFQMDPVKLVIMAI